MIASLRDNDELQLTAYCDGELDPVAAAEFERRLATDESLRARYSRLMSLREAVRSLPLVDVPSDLQARIQARLNAERANNVTVLRRRSWSFQALAASAVFGAVISGSVMLTMERYAQQEAVAGEVVAGHIRGLLAAVRVGGRDVGGGVGDVVDAGLVDGEAVDGGDQEQVSLDG